MIVSTSELTPMECTSDLENQTQLPYSLDQDIDPEDNPSTKYNFNNQNYHPNPNISQLNIHNDHLTHDRYVYEQLSLFDKLSRLRWINDQDKEAHYGKTIPLLFVGKRPVFILGPDWF